MRKQKMTQEQEYIKLNFTDDSIYSFLTKIIKQYAESNDPKGNWEFGKTESLTNIERKVVAWEEESYDGEIYKYFFINIGTNFNIGLRFFDGAGDINKAACNVLAVVPDIKGRAFSRSQAKEWFVNSDFGCQIQNNTLTLFDNIVYSDVKEKRFERKGLPGGYLDSVATSVVWDNPDSIPGEIVVKARVTAFFINDAIGAFIKMYNADIPFDSGATMAEKITRMIEEHTATNSQ